jgi:hypothetical protein
MTNKLMLVVDLDETSEVFQRLDFDREMQVRNWQKVPEMQGTFVAEIEADIPDEEVLAACEMDLANAANHAEITWYDATCLIA